VVTDGVAVQANPIITGNIVTYLWTPSEGLSNPNISNPFVNPESSTAYTLKVVSIDGCETIATINATINRTTIVATNTFTPNGDGVNDTWNIKYLSQYTDAVVDIYNRYGKHLYHSIGYRQPWDGTSNSKPLPIGIYYYVIDLNYNSVKPITGYVTIIR
jgi:gliding motility-associated-like protein